METEEEWVEDSDLSPELRAKIYSLKTCRNRCLAHSQSENSSELAEPVLKMFCTVINNAGSSKKDQLMSMFLLLPGT